MKLEKLPNMPEPFGVKIVDIPPLNEMSYDEYREIGRICMKHLVVVIENQKLTPGKFSKFCYSWGTPHRIEKKVLEKFKSNHITEKFIETLERISFRKYPGLTKVTGKRTVEGKITGIAPNGELPWHTDESAKNDTNLVLLLYGVEGTKNTQTQFLENVTRYNKLNDYDKKFVDSLMCLYEHKYIGIDNDQYPKEILDIDEEDLIEIFHYYEDRNKNSLNTKPLIQISPGNHKGFSFNYNSFIGFEGKTKKESGDIVEWLKSILLVKENIYTHDWKDGNLIACDQVVTLHRRPFCDCSNRLLYRMACNFNKIEGI